MYLIHISIHFTLIHFQMHAIKLMKVLEYIQNEAIAVHIF
jgi:hypothetical protein